jgi:hypothetical protein
MDTKQIEEKLISEIKLSPLQAKTFLLITCYGKMEISQISDKLNISKDVAMQTAKELMKLGAFIDISESKFEAMHPRLQCIQDSLLSTCIDDFVNTKILNLREIR